MGRARCPPHTASYRSWLRSGAFANCKGSSYLTRSLRILITTVVVTAAGLALISALRFPLSAPIFQMYGLEGLAFWTLLTMAATMFPVETPRGPVVSTFIAPLLASTMIFGPTGGAIVAFLGTWD